MGIPGLLPTLKSITRHEHISRYQGKKVAIDGYSWLHKGAYGCSVELCEHVETDKYVTYCMQRIHLLRNYGVTPLVVFDGGKLPMKQKEEGARAKARQENLEKARSLKASGNTSAAFDFYQRAVDISPAVAKRLIEALKREGVEFVVAPYEADAQIAFLAINDRVHAVITEDSDLLPYGCPRVFFKMDKTGDGQEICLSDLGCNRGLNFAGFTHQMFLEMCIMAGCDFLKAPTGIGMKKAHAHMRKYRVFIRAVKNLRMNGAVSVPRGYEVEFQRAIWTFRHQRVFDADTGRIMHLRPLPEGGLVAATGVPDSILEEDPGCGFLGPPLADGIAAAIACGEVDPLTRMPFSSAFLPRQVNPLQLMEQPWTGRSGASGQGSQAKRGGGREPRKKLIQEFFKPVRHVNARFLETSRGPPSADGRLLPSEGDSADCESVADPPSASCSLPSRFLPSIAAGSSSSQVQCAANRCRALSSSHPSGGLFGCGASRLQQESALVLAEAAELLGKEGKTLRYNHQSGGSGSGGLCGLNGAAFGKAPSGVFAAGGSLEVEAEALLPLGSLSWESENGQGGCEADGEPLGLAESPTVEGELRKATGRTNAAASGIASEPSSAVPAPALPVAPASDEQPAERQKTPIPASVNRDFYAIASTDVKPARRDPKKSLRLPLSPVSQPSWSDCNPEEHSTAERGAKRKTSHFFGRNLKRCLGKDPGDGAGDELADGVSAEQEQFRTGNPWSSRSKPSGDDTEQENKGGADRDEEEAAEAVSEEQKQSRFHSLSHLPKFTATAAHVVDKFAKRRGILKSATLSRNMEFVRAVESPARTSTRDSAVWKPFKAPRAAKPGAVANKEEGREKNKSGDRFKKFTFTGA